jgi:hypothetical protein
MAETSAFIRYGQACFKHRGLMLPAAILLLLIPSPPLARNAIVTSLVGIAIALIGQSIRAGTTRAEYIIRGGKDHNVFAIEAGYRRAVPARAQPDVPGQCVPAVRTGRGVEFLGVRRWRHRARGGGAHRHHRGGGAFRAASSARSTRSSRRVPRLIPRLAGLGDVPRRRPVQLGPGDRQGIHAAGGSDLATALVAVVALWRASFAPARGCWR